MGRYIVYNQDSKINTSIHTQLAQPTGPEQAISSVEHWLTAKGVCKGPSPTRPTFEWELPRGCRILTVNINRSHMHSSSHSMRAKNHRVEQGNAEQHRLDSQWLPLSSMVQSTGKTGEGSPGFNPWERDREDSCLKL